MAPKARLATEAVITGIALSIAVWAAFADATWFERHVTARYCVDQSTLPWQVARGLALAAAAVLFVVVRPRLGRVAFRTPPRDLAITSIGIVLALVASLVVGEVILRRVQWDDILTAPDIPKTQPDARLGWTLKPSATEHLDQGSRFIYAVNARDERARHSSDLGDPTAPTLVVVGESIAMGHGLDWDDTFGAVVGRALQLQVVNIGTPAYGNDQAYLRLLDTLPRLTRPKLVVILFVPPQIRRNISPSRPHLVLGPEGALVPVPAATGLAALRLVRLFRDEPYHGDEPVQVTRAILVASAKAVRDHGGEPLFLITNYRPACSDPRRSIETELFAGLPHLRVDLTEADVLGPEDPHPSSRGARKLADAILGAVTGRPVR